MRLSTIFAPTLLLTISLIAIDSSAQSANEQSSRIRLRRQLIVPPSATNASAMNASAANAEYATIGYEGDTTETEENPSLYGFSRNGRMRDTRVHPVRTNTAIMKPADRYKTPVLKKD
jgi:hypothetical protein